MNNRRKIVILLGDGMGDYPIKELRDKTPLQVANIPTIRSIAGHGKLYLLKTIPEGMQPGSDVANMSLMGFNPKLYYNGRAPIEAAGAGIDLDENDVAFRCNLITVVDAIIKDHSAGHISTEEARVIVGDLNEKLFGNNDNKKIYVSSGYRHILVWKNANYQNLITTPPHDVLGQKVELHLPRGEGAAEVIALMESSKPILDAHPINRERIAQGKNPATQIWLWGQGKKTSLPSYKELYKLDGGVISAVDLVHGIGRLAGLASIKVKGATGFIDTNYAGKVSAAIETLQKKDFVFLHIEAPDECSHMGDVRLKIRAIEDFDNRVVKPILQWLEHQDFPYRLIIATDHRTPVTIRNHTSEPVPMVVLDGPCKNFTKEASFDEYINSGIANDFAFDILKKLLSES